jgi:multiple sugar transport system ATP-binding protein
MSTKIRLDNITKRYGDIIAVDNVSTEFQEGAYTMILGPSGSGKSTLLRIIAGLESPSEGDVFIDGENVTDTAPRERELSMVFQNLALWDHKSVRENMGFGLKMEGMGTSERRTRVQEIAELLQIEDKLDANPTQLSGGQQQRVALGRSLVRQPDVVLLDEPLSSLDERLRLEMRTELRRIQRETDTTFIHVTHNQEDSMTIADDILLIHEGKLQQFGSPLDLYHEPANEFVADFIGSPSMNIFEATIDDEDWSLHVDGAKLQLPDNASDRITDHTLERLRVGIRPESISIENGTPNDTRLPATVTIVETFGDYNWYYLDWDGGIELVAQSADESVMDSVNEGDQVEIYVPPSSIHLFDPSTGDALA